MHLPLLNIFEPFYKKYKETLLYLFFGGTAFFLNIGLFAAINYCFHINELVNNIICWIICVFYQYFTNKTWVFDGHVDTIGALIKQILSFFGGRLFTLFIEEVIIAIFITWLGFNTMIVKLVAQIIVIILNYVISKLVVFKKPT
ncbi:MAG: GtrA family protein [Treponema sp.]|nr:GtrA family protein [Treponema sp.]